MAYISQDRLTYWMWKFLLGTLSKDRTQLLKEELERRQEKGQIFTELERKILAAFTVNRPTREYLASLLDSEEKRKWGN